VESGPIHAARAQDAAGRCRFSNYFVTDSLCCPSRSSIFTGRFPHDTGIFRDTGSVGGFMAFHNRHHEQSIFATPLQAVGYRTAMLGTYLNGYEPAKDSPEPGWSMWAVAGNGCPEFNYGLNEDGKVAHYGREPTDYLTDVLSGKAVNFIKQSAGAPFMIKIATFAPRKPYTPAPLKEIVENIDLNPTFNEVGGATTSANVDGLSLVPLLHGEPVAAWRKVALVEQQGPARPGFSRGAQRKSDHL
jgi:arylsulfatase A-like enzyme